MQEEYSEFVRTEIAAFLKDYGYVKEYGEGVDRMCKELEAIGLPDPVYNNNTFILKTTVLSASFEHESTQNARIGDKNVRIETTGSWLKAKNVWIEYVKELQVKGKITGITSTAIIDVLEDIRENQVIGTKDVQKILDCSERKALRIITEMKKAKIIIPIVGQGKGKYILNVTD